MKKRKLKSKVNKIGQLPGSLTYTGHNHPEKTSLRLLQYNETDCSSIEDSNPEIILKKFNKEQNSWIHFYTLNQIEAIEKVGAYFNIHNLMLEDILNVDHLPKVEFSEEHIFFTLKVLSLNDDYTLNHEHASFILGERYLISFKEHRGELLKPVRERLENNIGKSRKKRTDYLFYLLIDAIVDNYYILQEKLQERIEDLEDALIDNPSENQINEIHKIKKTIISVRKYVFALRDAIINLIKEEPMQIFESNYKYLRDVLDHVNFVYESIEAFREDQKSLMELNSSNLNNNLNQVMKTLTIVASVFIPLTFIAGIYGMNFQYIPELTWKYGYFIALGVMAIISILMIWYMKRKKWF